MTTRGLLIIGVAATLLAGCGSKTPSGQVVATVGKHEITMRQLEAEMAGVRVTDPKQERPLEIAALRNIVGRTILADAARARKLDKSPDFVLSKERAEDVMLAQALERQVASSTPATSADDAQKFIDQNPDMFAQRKIFTLDQIRMGRITDANLVKQLESLHSLDQIQQLLTANGVTFQRGSAELDADSIDPRVTAGILKLPPGEPFILPAQNVVTINVVKDTKVVPFIGPAATAFAQKFVTTQREQQAVKREMAAQFAQGLKKVKFAKDFQAAAAPAPGGAANAQTPRPGKAAPK